MKMERVDESDILAAARELQGLERLDQIKHAVVESTGGITIVPKAALGRAPLAKLHKNATGRTSLCAPFALVTSAITPGGVPSMSRPAGPAFRSALDKNLVECREIVGQTA